ncbi:MAG: hypothetical protein AAFO07_13420 [Bacteroidota bacterium]
MKQQTTALIPVGKGAKYALWFVLLGAVMGLIYGAFGGVLLQPALFSVAITGIMVVLNFIIALIVFLPNVLFMIFKRSSKLIHRYFGLSLGFLIVYLAFFALLKFSGLEVF